MTCVLDAVTITRFVRLHWLMVSILESTASSAEATSVVRNWTSQQDVLLPPLIQSTDSGCTCKNLTGSDFTGCTCRGDDLKHIPDNLAPNLRTLTVTNAAIEVIEADSLISYRSTLADVSLNHLTRLRVIEQGVFNNLPALRTIVINYAPSLKSIPDAFFRTSLPELRIFRCTYTGLGVVPAMKYLGSKHPMSIIDLDNNQIEKLTRGSIQVTSDQLWLNYNKIREIEALAFFNSTLATLSLKGNRELKMLDSDAFTGLRSLRHLDLSDTSITFLPTSGLRGLEELKIQGTKSLKVFPSIYSFDSLKEVWLTYSCHCCAFHFPAQHDPLGYLRHQEFMLRIKEEQCTSQKNHHTELKKHHGMGAFDQDWGFSVTKVLPTGSFLEGQFHSIVSTNKKINALCGNISKNYEEVKCFPRPDAFNPCEDLMGNWVLRVAVWLVAILALLGNLAVLLVLLSSRFRMTVPKFLMCNLALADLCMGLYLLLIAIMDARSIGDYFNYAIDWQNGIGCKLAGFLTVFASELSIFTLTVITCERWYTITYAIHLNKRLRLSSAAQIMVLGWIYSITMATLPFFGISSYSITSICLPMENAKTSDLVYLVTLLVFNSLAFWVICACYSRMYVSIRGGQGQATADPLSCPDMRVAKRMALLVFTDFACWAPIAFFALTALAGLPLIDVPKTKILLVFFYPLNSCANPYLYALLTQQYRRDFFILLSR
uniref:Neuropeptide GPCR A49 n=1 Tax=Nilaparvata lugens TaxID=108931 RepID=U3U984_NILLU|nr:neuropeptide GPCR A49 [Nilaparvata lugens]